MRLLAFDASSTVGWASFASARAIPALGHYELSRSLEHGARALDMQRHVLRLIEQHNPELIAFEQPIFYPRDRWFTRRLLTSLVVVIELVATMKGLRCIEIEPSTAKRCLTGDSRADKAAMVAAAQGMGWSVANHHEADACAVALAAYGMTQGVRA